LLVLLFCASLAVAPVQAVCQVIGTEIVDLEPEQLLLEKAAQARDERKADRTPGVVSALSIKPTSDSLTNGRHRNSKRPRGNLNGFGGFLRL
jgi:hypothetical protein